MVIVIVVKDHDPVQLRMDDIYDHSFVSTIQHHVHHISNKNKCPSAAIFLGIAAHLRSKNEPYYTDANSTYANACRGPCHRTSERTIE
jgi:hypothetical protein